MFAMILNSIMGPWDYQDDSYSDFISKKVHNVGGGGGGLL